MTICERMFELMGFRGIKSATISKKLGIPANTLTNWSQRNTDPPAKYIVPICEVLGCSVTWLLTGEQENPPEPWLDHMDREVVDLYRKMPFVQQKVFLEHLREAKNGPLPAITENGQEMLELFDQLPDREQVLLIGRLQEMVSPMLDIEKKSHASSGEQAV